jgi:hypothetical protein
MEEVFGSSPNRPTMKDKYTQEEEDKINERMAGWTVQKVEIGQNGENLFIFSLVKGSNTRSVILCGNDLGGWLSEKTQGPKKKK